MTKPKRNDPEQSKRFIETATEVGADDDGEALERAFKKIAPPKASATNQAAPALSKRRV